jgi:hypothetical protein
MSEQTDATEDRADDADRNDSAEADDDSDEPQPRVKALPGDAE